MRKHILGFAVFSFIVSSFAVAFAFIYAPAIPRENSVEVSGFPVYKAEPRSSCHKKKPKKLEFDIVSSQLDLQKKKLYTRVSLKWNGREPAPKSLFANVKLLIPSEQYSMYDSINTVTAFNIENSTTILLESDLNAGFPKNQNENIYTRIVISENISDEIVDDTYSDVFPVVVIHGKKENSSINRKIILQ